MRIWRPSPRGARGRCGTSCSARPTTTSTTPGRSSSSSGCGLPLEPAGRLPPERVAEALAEESEVADRRRAHLSRGDVPVVHPGLAVGVEQALHGGAGSVAVVLEAVGEEGPVEALEAAP